MSTHDPISDLITRIRNAQMRSKSKVSSPGSRMRANVLDIFRRRAGNPRDRAGIEAGAARLCLGEEPAAREQRARHFGIVDPEGNYG